MEAIISDNAKPASTSPPTVFKRMTTPSILGFCSIAINCGKICSYLVVLFFGGICICSSSLPIIDNMCILVLVFYVIIVFHKFLIFFAIFILIYFIIATYLHIFYIITTLDYFLY